MMVPSPTAIRLALTFGLTVSGALAGTNISVSAWTVPTLLHLPKALLIQQWRSLYKRGAKTAPPFAALAFASLVYVAISLYQNDPNDSKWKMIGIAATATMAIVPFTLIFAQSTIDKLMADGDKQTSLTEEEVKGLVQRWSNLNTLRSLFPLSATVIGLWAVMA